METLDVNHTNSSAYLTTIISGIAIGVIVVFILYPVGAWLLNASCSDALTFMAVNWILCLFSVTIFYIRFRDGLSPHIMIPFFYSLLIVPSVALLEPLFSEEVIHKIYQATLLGQLSFILGGLATFIFFRKPKMVQIPVKIDLHPVLFKQLSLLVWGIGVIAVLFTFLKAGIPLLADDPQLARFEMLRQVGGYVNNLFILIIPGSILLVINYYLGNLSGKWCLGLIGFSVGLFFLFAFRSRVIYTLVAGGISAIYSIKIISGQKIAYRRYLKYFLMLVPAIIFTFAWIGYYRLEKTGELQLYFPIFSENLVVIVILMFALYLRSLTVVMGKAVEIATMQGFLSGQSYLNAILSPLPGFSPQLLDEYLKEQIFPKGYTGGGSPPTIIGESYLNFGLPGVVIILFLIGFLLAYLYQRLLRDRKISTLVLFCYFYQFFLISGILGGMLIFFDYVLAVSVILIVIYLCRKKQSF